MARIEKLIEASMKAFMTQPPYSPPKPYFLSSRFNAVKAFFYETYHILQLFVTDLI